MAAALTHRLAAEIYPVAYPPSEHSVCGGEVLFEYAQAPLPPPIDSAKQVFGHLAVENGGFCDWFAPCDTHIYRFALC